MTPEQSEEFKLWVDSEPLKIARAELTRLLEVYQNKLNSVDLTPDQLRLVQGQIQGATAARNILGGAYFFQTVEKKTETKDEIQKVAPPLKLSPHKVKESTPTSRS